MSDFKQAFDKLMKNEGGYVNDSVDRGGETYKGVSRNNWPNWQGWKAIDDARNSMDFPHNLDFINTLQANIYFFYKDEFWKRIKGDDIKDQEIAESLFDYAVNAGVKTAVKLIQEASGVDTDGILGVHTLGTLNSIRPELLLLRFMNLKIHRYIKICRKNKSQKKFFYGWFSRSVV